MKTLLVLCASCVTFAAADPAPRIQIHEPLVHAAALLQPEAIETPRHRPEAVEEKQRQEGEKSSESGPELQFQGFAATSYNVNFRPPAGGKNLLRGYDADDRKLKLDGLNLDFQYGMSGVDQVGFRLDTVLGGSYPRVDAAAGLFRDPYTGRSNTDFDIRQAFIRYSPAEDWQIDAGKFATWLGYEIMPGVDGKNPHGTPAFGYTFNPFTHTGMRVLHEPNEHVSLVAAVVLGADNFQDTNGSVSFGGQVNWHPTEEFSLVFNALDGPEQIRNNTDRRRYFDVVANYEVTPAVNLGLYTFFASERGLSPTGGTSHYHGLTFYVQSQLSEKLHLNARQEFFNDPEGIRLGVPARIRSFTLTPEYRFTPDWAMRVDLRFDKADMPVFEAGGVATDYQNTVFFQQTLKF